MIVVSNTSPLIALAKIEHLFILAKLFEQVLIPRIVADEFQANCTAKEKQDFQAGCESVLKVVEVTFVGSFSRKLDFGEQAVLGLALQQELKTVLIDDRKGFNEAKEQSLKPISTRALLRVAEQYQVIKDFHELEHRLQYQQFFLPSY